MNYDEVDRKILEILDQDARTKFTTIAKTIQKTEGTVRNRIRRLQEKGIIEGFRVITDPINLGYTVQAIIKFQLVPNYENFIQIESLPQISEWTNTKLQTLYRANGDNSFLIDIISKSKKNLNLFISEIKKLNGVYNIDILIKEEKIFQNIT